MELMSLAAATLIDPNVPTGQIEHRRGKLAFSSVVARQKWLRDVEKFLLSEGVPVETVETISAESVARLIIGALK